MHKDPPRTHKTITYVINEQCTYGFELENQSRKNAQIFWMLTSAVHCTYRYVQLLPQSSGVYELSVSFPVAV